MKIVKIKNNQEIADTYCGQSVNAGEYYQLKDSDEIEQFAMDSKVQAHINPYVNDPVKIIVNDGVNDLSYSAGLAWLQNTNIQEVQPTAPKNEYDLRPYGLGHKHINASNQIYDITLSNKDGKNVDYSNCSTTPQFYDCIFQDHSEIRDGILSVSGSTITTFLGRLDTSKSAQLSVPINIDYKIETIEDVDLIYLWGIYIDTEGGGEDDILRLQVCDPDEVGVAAGLYTSEQIEAMGYIVKEYDECWARHVSKVVELNTPDGSPGEILNGMYLRVKYYCKDPTKTNIKVWKDYKITIKES